MTSHAKVTSKGQVTIPAEIRRRLHIKQGDVLVFELDEQGDVRLRVLPQQSDNVFDRYRGIWREGEGMTIEEVNEAMRKFRGHEE